MTKAALIIGSFSSAHPPNPSAMSSLGSLTPRPHFPLRSWIVFPFLLAFLTSNSNVAADRSLSPTMERTFDSIAGDIDGTVEPTLAVDVSLEPTSESLFTPTTSAPVSVPLNVEDTVAFVPDTTDMPTATPTVKVETAMPTAKITQLPTESLPTTDIEEVVDADEIESTGGSDTATSAASRDFFGTMSLVAAVVIVLIVV